MKPIRDNGRYAVVVGGVNIDIGGIPHQALRMQDSNPGKVRLSVGGVGQNIARNLALLDVPVHFLTAYGWDGNGAMIETACERAGIDLSSALRLREEPTSVYLYIADERGEMQLAVSDMDICGRLTEDYLRMHEGLLNGAAAVVVDANIPQESVRFLAEHCAAPLFGDPVSTAKAQRLQESLGRFQAVKPNRQEAELLTGRPIRSEEDLPAAAEALLASGLRQVFISLGGDGVYAADHERTVRLPCLPAKLRNMTGAGDAFLAGLVRSFLDGGTLEEMALFASAAAAVSAEGMETVNEALCLDRVMAMLSARK